MDQYDTASQPGQPPGGFAVEVDNDTIEIGGAALLLGLGVVAGFALLLYLALRETGEPTSPAAPGETPPSGGTPAKGDQGSSPVPVTPPAAGEGSGDAA